MALPAVPNTTTFTLKDVADALALSGGDLVAFFNAANPDYFNPLYYNEGNDLLEFRDYGIHNAPATAPTMTVFPDIMSFDGAGEGFITHITVTTEPIPESFTIVSSPHWVTCMVDPIFKNRINVVVNTNFGGARTGYIDIKHSSDSTVNASVRVDQAEQGSGGMIL